MKSYSIWDVTHWPVASEETLGSKEKDWLRRPGTQNELWLWKATREGTGDDWAEKVAEQLAALIDLPHARVELAIRGERRGVICQDFRRNSGTFVPGNELLWQADPSYPKTRRRKVVEHTVERILERLEVLDVHPPQGAKEWVGLTGAVFAGYLMFDAWIANQDRHHENWGVIVWDDAAVVGAPEMRIELAPSLAPSFDHASSLGQYEQDEKRELRLRTTDKGGRLKTWALKAKSQIYRTESDSKPLSTFDAFMEAQVRYADHGSDWPARLRAVSMDDVGHVTSAVPEPLLSTIGSEFALRLLEYNRSVILARIP